jgi:hypothetical protein
VAGTQAEVDALSAVSLGEVMFGGETPQARRVETWELDRPRNSVELRGLDLVHDAFAEAASSSLTGLLSLPVVVARHNRMHPHGVTSRHAAPLSTRFRPRRAPRS